MKDEQTHILLTLDEIERGQDNVTLAILVTDAGEKVVVPLDLLPDSARVGDVLRVHFARAPDERERRRSKIADLQRRLFGTG